MKRLEVRTRRLILRPLKSSDYDSWFEAYVRGLPKQTKWDIEPLNPDRCTKRRFNRMNRDHERLAKDDKYYRYYIFEKNTCTLVGLIDFDIFIRSTHQFGNFGYQIFNRYWRKGYGQEAARAGLKIGFLHLGLNRLEAAMNLDNRASIRLSKKIGMRREGVKKRYWFEYGKWTDHLIYVANPEDVGLKSRKPK